MIARTRIVNVFWRLALLALGVALTLSAALVLPAAGSADSLYWSDSSIDFAPSIDRCKERL